MKKEITKEQKIKKVTFLGMFINIFLSLIKIIFGYLGHSSALVADGIHSFSDLLSDFAIIWGVKAWSKSPDEKHPYGHLRVETFITFFIIIILSFVAISIISNAIENWKLGIYNTPSFITLLIAFISIVIKEYLYRKTKIVAQETNSSALEANAWHHRSDALSSLPVFVAIILTKINPNWKFFDYLGAILVSVFIIHFIWKMLVNIVKELMETAAPEDYLVAIVEIIKEHPEVKSHHCLRTRKVGSAWFIDFHLQVDEDISVKEGHRISAEVKKEILEKLEHFGIIEILIHLEPYDESRNHCEYLKY